MKKHCTPSNNAMTIAAPVAYNTVVPTESCGCINPIVYLINEANVKSISDGTSFGMAVAGLLNSGIYITDSSKFCCPDCDDIYFLGAFELFTNDYLSIVPDMKCCYNYVGPINWMNQYPEIKNLECCKTDFVDCVSLINELPEGQNITFSNSIFEYNTLNNNSGLCVLYQELKKNKFFDFPQELQDILNLGIVVRCQDCKIFIGSSQTYYNIFID